MGLGELLEAEALSLDMARFLELAVRARRNIVVSGGTGTGKTHLCIGVAAAVIRSRARGRFFNLVDLVNQLEQEKADLLRATSAADQASDELVPGRRGEEDQRQQLYRMIGADLTTIDGVGVETAEAMVSEYGVDLSKFSNEKQFIAHLQLAPRQAISGGKPLPKRTRKTKGTRGFFAKIFRRLPVDTPDGHG